MRWNLMHMVAAPGDLQLQESLVVELELELASAAWTGAELEHVLATVPFAAVCATMLLWHLYVHVLLQQIWLAC